MEESSAFTGKEEKHQLMGSRCTVSGDEKHVVTVCSDKADTLNPDADHLSSETHGHRAALIYNHPEDVTNDL